MRVPLLELFLTACLAAGFAAVGEVALRRRSRGFAGGNEAMLVGMGVCAAALFPLTLAFPHGAVVAEAIVIGGCLLWVTVARFREPRPAGRAAPSAPDPVARWILAVVALVAIGFIALNFRFTYSWDGFLIWATKAQILSHAGGLTREWFLDDKYDLRHLAYPPLVALYESLLSLCRGGFDFDKLKPIFLVFYLSMLVGTYSAARAVVSARLAAMATLLVCLVPALSTRHAAGAYADMPQAAVVAGVVAASMSRRADALPWLIGALTTVKAEGMILAALACAGVLLFWLLESPRGIFRSAARKAGGIAIVAIFLILRIAYVRWIHAPNNVYEAGLALALSRIPFVSWRCFVELVDPLQWGLFWPAFLAALVILLMRGATRARCLAAATGAGLVVLVVPFLFTNWPLELHIAQAYSRLAAQLAPAAATVIVLGYARVRPSPAQPGVLG
jgi:hypothetical protein